MEHVYKDFSTCVTSQKHVIEILILGQMHQWSKYTAWVKLQKQPADQPPF